MSLNKKQTDWIYKRLDALYSKWFPLLPLTEEQWIDLRDEVVALDHLVKGQKNTDCRDMIFAFVKYVDVISAKGSR